MSEESVKRRLALLLAPLLLAAAPVPLVTGAVRDQYGSPIQGAVVRAGTQSASTDTNGTFALRTAASGDVVITCTFCRETRAPIAADGTVTAIVRRYSALADSVPSRRDLASLPYEHAESSISLAPFVILNSSQTVLPGPEISYYGTSSAGGLLIDDGIPFYDIAAGATPWRTIPAYNAQSAASFDQRYAFRYGDLAGGGTFFVDTKPEDGGASGLFAAGTNGAARIAASTSGSAGAAAVSYDGTELADRAQAWTQFAAGEDSLRLTALVDGDSYANAEWGSIDTNTSAVRLHYDRVRTNTLYGDVVAERSEYGSLASYGTSAAGGWSDFSAQAGLSTNAPIAFFADVFARSATGYYDATSAGLPRVAGSAAQVNLSTGASWQSDRASWSAGVGAFAVSYSGGSQGSSQGLSAHLLTPSVSGSWEFAPGWTAEVAASNAFRLPTLIETYAYPMEYRQLPYDRYGSMTESIQYADSRRFRASFLAMNQRVSNLDNGMVHSAGVEAAWQVTPLLSLRAWAMHYTDTSLPPGPIVRFGNLPSPSTPGSIWLTYDNAPGMRVDAIYRRDLIDFLPDQHFDASISGPLRPGVQWFAGTERVQGSRYVNAGLRFGIP